MIRTQIQLSESQFVALKEAAAAEGWSVAEAVRLSVEEWLRGRRQASRAEVKERSIASLGRFASGVGDLGERHDDYLDEAFGE